MIASACSSTQDTPPGPTAGAFQLRPVIEVVRRSAAAWDQTELTCTELGQDLRDCVASATTASPIVLLGPAGEKYVLGRRIADGSDIEDAAAQPDASPGTGWSVWVNLMADGTAALETATEAAVGSKIAIVVDGRIASAPTVQTPIASGDLVAASGLTEREATSLASRLDAR